jgi:hypothetical protein
MGAKQRTIDGKPIKIQREITIEEQKRKEKIMEMRAFKEENKI